MQLIPRAVAFVDGRAVAVGMPCVHYREAKKSVISLPTDHYDFIGPINVIGKTKEEIETEAATYAINS